MVDQRNKITFRPILLSDLDVLYEAYLANSFDMVSGFTKEQFSKEIIKLVESYQETIIVEDGNRPIAFVSAYFNGWVYEPHVEFFSWASKRSILNSSIKFFTEVGKLKSIGVINVKALESSKTLFDHVCRYGCLKYIGTIEKGDYRGNEYIYSRTGDAKCNAKCTFPTSRNHPTRAIHSATL